MAIACLRLLTVPPLPPLPDLRVPRFSRCTALFTLFAAAFPYFAILSSELRLILNAVEISLAALSANLVSRPFLVVFVADGQHPTRAFQNVSRRHHLRVPRCTLGDFVGAHILKQAEHTLDLNTLGV